MDKRTQAQVLTNLISNLMAKLEDYHECCFNKISPTFDEIERSVIRASDAQDVGKLLFYSNLIAKSLDEVTNE